MMSFTKTAGNLLLVVSLAVSCGKKGNENPSEVLAGTTSKTWQIAKQTDSNGNKEKLSETEKDEKLNLYADGKFSIVSDQGTATGTWSVQNNTDPKTLTLQFQDQPVTENFAITEMEKDKVTLKAGDGSEMVLKAD